MTETSENGVVCVVGLGKIGLPLAVQCALAGREVIGCDVAAGVVEAVNHGSAPFDSEQGLAEALRRVHGEGRLRATTDTTAAAAAASVIVIIVPVALTDSREVDFHHIDAATLSVGAGLRPGTLVVYETTLPVGTTRGRLAQLLQSASHLDAGTDFQLAFSPERVYSGRIFRDLARYPKIVGGVDSVSTEAALRFYQSVLQAEVRALSSAEAAEYTKLVETTYRDVNIALANEFALYAEREGLDAQEVITAANSQPFSHVHQPSVGVGGHCIPVYPYFLFSKWDDFRLPPLARAINDSMAAHGVDLLEEALGNLAGLHVLILGLAYRENVKESAHTSARKLSRELRHRGATVLGHDPLLTLEEQTALKIRPVSLSPLPEVDAVILQANHDAYRELDLSAFPGIRVVLDGRGAVDAQARQELAAKGIRTLRVGLAASLVGERE
ncbi:MAG TPA: nucleotide sugar dehydrogenase [Chloroflexota bacterium]|nr:nucleotide sugar dehydrogenase [Chloroflexota bacterium]